MRLTDDEFDILVKNVQIAAAENNCDATVLHERETPFAEVGTALTAEAKAEKEKENKGEMAVTTDAPRVAVSASKSTAVAEPPISASPAPKNQGRFAHLLIRKRPGNMEDVLEIRVAVVGNVDAGKSTLLGVLTKDVLDDGRGKARVNLFKHKHEIETGRTSSVGMEIMGFDSKGAIVTPAVLGRPRIGWEDICSNASKVISFIDLAGHERYLKTTVFGMSGSDPHFVMLMVGSNAGIVGMTKEHLGLALCLNLPVFIVVTKIDMTPKPVLEQTLKQLTKILKSSGCRKIPMHVRNMDDALLVAGNFVSERICPIFQVSNVSGEGLPLLKSFLNIIHSNTKGKYDASKPTEFHITGGFWRVRSHTVRTRTDRATFPQTPSRFLASAQSSVEP
jgi:GTPase